MSLTTLFMADRLAIIMVSLIVLLGGLVLLFSRRYFKGSPYYARTLCLLTLFQAAMIAMVLSDNLIVFAISLLASQVIMVKLLALEAGWQAAKRAAKLSLRAYLCAWLLVVAALSVLALHAQTLSLQAITNTPAPYETAWIIMSALILGAMIMSALFPFHHWIWGSLNSPAPVSAIMHAGLVNGGGYLLIRCHELLMGYSTIMMVIVVLGLLSCLFGTLCKLVHANVKGMLAASTTAQMGFMFTQIGLGLWPAALAHLCLHGMFKATLFLSNPSLALNNTQKIDNKPTNAFHWIMALFAGVSASLAFAWASNMPWLAANTTLLVQVIVMLFAAQMTLSLRHLTGPLFWLSYVPAISCAALYGLTVRLFETLLAPQIVAQPQALSWMHLSLVVLPIGWLLVNLQARFKMPEALYVKMLNASQPCDTTQTPYRHQYREQSL